MVIDLPKLAKHLEDSTEPAIIVRRIKENIQIIERDIAEYGFAIFVDTRGRKFRISKKNVSCEFTAVKGEPKPIFDLEAEYNEGIVAMLGS